MKTSRNRILTTHVGSLPRTDAVVDLLVARENRAAVDDAALERTMRRAVLDVVRRQVEIGIDVVSDGETSKIGYATYVRDRLGGFSEDGSTETPKPHLDLRPFPDLQRKMALLTGPRRFKRVACVGPVKARDRAPLERDLENMRAASDATPPVESFMTASSPGVVTSLLPNAYYPTHEAYIAAVSDVCRKRVGEDFMLQEDADRFIAAAKARNPLDPSVPLAPLIQAGAYTGR